MSPQTRPTVAAIINPIPSPPRLQGRAGSPRFAWLRGALALALVIAAELAWAQAHAHGSAGHRQLASIGPGAGRAVLVALASALIVMSDHGFQGFRRTVDLHAYGWTVAEGGCPGGGRTSPQGQSFVNGSAKPSRPFPRGGRVAPSREGRIATPARWFRYGPGNNSGAYSTTGARSPPPVPGNSHAR